MNYPVLALGVQMYWSHLIFILFLSIRATTLPFPHVPSLHTAWAPSTIWRIQWEINVLLRVQTHNVWWDIDKLFAHTGEKEKKSQLHQFNPRAWDIFPFSFSYVLVQITFSDEPNGRFSKCCWPLQLLRCLSNHTHLNGALLKDFFGLHHNMTVSGNLPQFLKQSDSKLNPIVTWSFTFPVAVCLFFYFNFSNFNFGFTQLNLTVLHTT